MGKLKLKVNPIALRKIGAEDTSSIEGIKLSKACRALQELTRIGRAKPVHMIGFLKEG